MDRFLIVVFATVVLVAIASFLMTRPDREAAARKREEEELWRRIEIDLAIKCPALSNEVACGGTAKPIRESKNRYHCPVCGGQFIGKFHGW